MKPYCHFTGTVAEDPKIITSGKRPFLAFKVESPDSYSEWPNRMDCVCYDKDLEAVKAKLTKGATVTVQGEVSASAYLSTQTQKPVGTLKLFVKAFECFGPGTSAAPAQQTAPARQSATRQAAPVAEDTDSSIPF